MGSPKVVLNEGILNNFIEQTLPKIKSKNYYIRKIFALSLSDPGVQPINKSLAPTALKTEMKAIISMPEL